MIYSSMFNVHVTQVLFKVQKLYIFHIIGFMEKKNHSVLTVLLGLPVIHHQHNQNIISNEKS